MYSISFNCIPKKKEKLILNQILEYINSKNKKIISIFGEENIKEREEKKIRELKQEIGQKNLEIKLRQYIIEHWENSNLNNNKNEKNNIKYIDKITKDIEIDYKKLSDELEVLYACQFIINKMNKNKNGINEEIKNSFKNYYDICDELFKKIKENKKNYLILLKQLSDYIKNINGINMSTKDEKEENIDNNRNIILFKEEKESIEKLEYWLDTFEDLIKKKLYKCLLNTPLENIIKENNFDNN